MYIGLDIGGTKTAVLLTSATKEPLLQTKRPTDKKNLIPSLIQIIQDTINEADQDMAQLCGIGLGIPGIVNSEKGEVTMAVNLDILKPLPLAKQLSKALRVPVLMENDVRLAAVGLHDKHQIEDLIYLNVGTGVAAGILINGRLHRGATNGAGEVGHIPLRSTEQIFELTVAGPGIMRQAKSISQKIKHPGDLYALANNGDASAKHLVQKISNQLSEAILWLLMAFDSEAIFLGGGVTKIGHPFLDPILDSLAKARQHSQLAQIMVPNEKVRLVASDFNAGLWGAIAFARQAAEN